ncbi:ABC transporter ATP-binding protein [Pseudonocardia sp. KRD-184]|uniref:ABC transporter ATP-binding protein n=1 Tax=Pseudonocardia oceani TaxID=2792013 RepID=A0ABS6UDB3_9PSEU|nr:ABC transporter ATP-binding protein [Pseudonocardia oceani]MBW0088545.1 ABC transporter ATP-binding protein [Pseudonocardia oceani]MBW0095775.1 ABC transporter ATP-binding protein [Pseudonocardia oceani]MBW0108334.1 ABC transporter ATP-binding protein [Pseudonocardia oceani]MBW0120176.1 ABC transporter ATP-binding protein [Pseudonocardia oceani]MBW0130220.1 ABC transporter ATP-binding protein [Pseudonocardia oceani]
MTVRIGCRDLRVGVRDRDLLHVEHLDVDAGETLAVLGPNGAGKSTLLRALARIGRPHRAGQVLLDGRPADARAVRAAVAAVLQRPILRRGTVAANAAAGLRLRGVGRAEAARRSVPWLDALGVGHLAGRDARTLSGGEAQRVAIARALAVGPRVLLLDEPFAGLDATTRTDLVADLRAVLDDLDTATVLVTHDRHEAHALAGRTALLVAGRIRQHGPTARVLDRPADADCAQLVGCTNLLPPALTGRSGLLVARPEHCRPLRLDDAPPPGDVRVPGTVRRIVPLGAGVRIDVDPESGGRPLACLVPAGGAVGLQRGSPTAVTVANADLRAVPPDA